MCFTSICNLNQLNGHLLSCGASGVELETHPSDGRGKDDSIVAHARGLVGVVAFDPEIENKHLKRERRDDSFMVT